MKNRHFTAKTFVVAVSVLMLALLFAPAALAGPKNILYFIGDGMGPEQVKAGGMYANGAAGTLSFESFPNSGYLTTAPAGGGVTDSAAAGTALATGQKVYNGVISIANPGDGSELETLLEHYKGRGWSTGLVTTTYMTHATPAAFGAHNASRNNTGDIGNDYATQTRPDVLLGGGSNGMPAAPAGYTVVIDAAGMAAVDTEAAGLKLSGQFGSTHLPYEYDGLGALPSLSDMTQTALDVLDGDPDGLFLMVEGGKIDHACHSSDILRATREAAEFGNAVQVGIDWAATNPDTLIIVTADHETGGLLITGHSGNPLDYPTATWSGGGGHTGANVPVYASGVGADRMTAMLDENDVMSNTGVYTLAYFEAEPEPDPDPDPDAVPEPAGLALVGLALLASKRRRS